MEAGRFFEKIEDWGKRHDFTSRTVADLIYHAKGAYLFDLKWNMQGDENLFRKEEQYLLTTETLRIKQLFSEELDIFEDYIAEGEADFNQNEQRILQVSVEEWGQSLKLPLVFIKCVCDYAFAQYRVSDLKVVDFYFLCCYHSDSLFDMVDELFHTDASMANQLGALVQLCSDAYIRRQEFRLRNAQLYQLSLTLDDSLDNWGIINKIPKNIVTGLQNRYKTVNDVCTWAINRPKEKLKFMTMISGAYDGKEKVVEHFKEVLESTIESYQMSQSLQEQQKQPESLIYIKHPPTSIPETSFSASSGLKFVLPPPSPPVSLWECNMCHLINEECSLDCRSCFTPRRPLLFQKIRQVSGSKSCSKGKPISKAKPSTSSPSNVKKSSAGVMDAVLSFIPPLDLKFRGSPSAVVKAAPMAKAPPYPLKPEILSEPVSWVSMALPAETVDWLAANGLIEFQSKLLEHHIFTLAKLRGLTSDEIDQLVDGSKVVPRKRFKMAWQLLLHPQEDGKEDKVQVAITAIIHRHGFYELTTEADFEAALQQRQKALAEALNKNNSPAIRKLSADVSIMHTAMDEIAHAKISFATK